MNIYATSHAGRVEGDCCSSAPHLHPTRHPLTSSLEKEGSLFVMDSICLFPIPTVGNMETKPPSHFPFHSPSSFPRPLLPSTHHKLSIVWYHISLNGSLRVRHSRCRFFFCFFLTIWHVFQKEVKLIRHTLHDFGNTTSYCDDCSQTYFYAFLCGFRHINRDFTCQPDRGLLGKFLICLWRFFFVLFFLKTSENVTFWRFKPVWASK